MHRLFRQAIALRSGRQTHSVYATIEAEFDRDYYLRRYDDVARAQIDPVTHYIRHGAAEGRDPSPLFATRYYLKRYPDVARSRMNPFFHYLKFGRAEGRGATPHSAGSPNFDTVCELLGRRPKEVEKDYIERRLDLRRRLDSGVLAEMVKEATKLEPLIGPGWRAAM